MAEDNWLQQLVERVVSQVLEAHVASLREELVTRVLSDLQPRIEGRSASTPNYLLQAIAAIHAASAQKDILAALLDGASHFCSRVALFVVRGGALVGWQARGFANNEIIKNFSIDSSSGLCGRALQERANQTGAAAEMDARFIEAAGANPDTHALVLPLMLKEKVAALLYADSGVQAGRLDTPSLEVLMHSGSLWLEVLALRRMTAGASPMQEAATEGPSPQPEAAPARVVEAPATVPTPEPAMAMAAAASASSPAIGGGAGVSQPASTVADDELQRKARRFAKLLVDEIKLYNQVKVGEGRKNKDLYDRLKDDIDKSRAAFEKRYGHLITGNTHYFDEEIVRNLAENDGSLLGANYSR